MTVEYKYRARLIPPQTYTFIEQAGSKISSDNAPSIIRQVRGALRETKSLEYAQVTLGNYLDIPERIMLADSLRHLALANLEKNSYDRVARSALHFSSRLRNRALKEYQQTHS